VQESRHIKVKGEKSPYDGELGYWAMPHRTQVKTVHNPLKCQSLKALLYNSLKPVMIQFCTNRCHTRFNV
jgi:hypothetical protein